MGLKKERGEGKATLEKMKSESLGWKVEIRPG
jgi:hypothetical protein